MSVFLHITTHIALIVNSLDSYDQILDVLIKMAKSNNDVDCTYYGNTQSLHSPGGFYVDSDEWIPDTGADYRLNHTGVVQAQCPSVWVILT